MGLRMQQTALLAITPAAAPINGNVGVSFQQQVRPLWCWAACASMVVEWSGQTPRSQCAIAKDHLGIAGGCCGLTSMGCLDGPAGPELMASPCDQTRQPEDMGDLWQQQGIAATTKQDALDRNTLVGELNAKRPVVAWIEGARGNHLVVVAGVLSNGQLNVADPCDEGFTAIDYDALVHHFRGPWRHSWLGLSRIS